MDRISRLEAKIADQTETLKADREQLGKLKAQRRAETRAKAKQLQDKYRFIVGKVLLAYLQDTNGDKRDTDLRAGMLRVLDAGVDDGDRPALEKAFPTLKDRPSKSASKPRAADRPPPGGEAA